MAVLTLVLTAVIFSLIPPSACQSCKNDRDCYKSNTYCYVSGECVNCFNCAIYQRQNGTKCAHEPNQCGECLPGMTAEHTFDGILSVCRPTPIPAVTTTTDEPSDTKKESTDYVTWIGVPVLLIVVVVLIVISTSNIDCIIRCKRNIGDLLHNRCPPPYTEKTPSAPPYADHPANENSLTRQLPITTYHAENETQRANPFKTPDYVRRGHLSAIQNNDPPTDFPAEEAASEPLMGENSNLVNDDETQPSSWVPAENNAGESAGRQNFLNILSDRTDQLTITQPSRSRTEVPHSTYEPDEEPANNRSQSTTGNIRQINLNTTINVISTIINNRTRSDCQEQEENSDNSNNFTLKRL